MNSFEIIGFTLLRDGVRYDYPFAESLKSLSPLCKKVVIALGKNDDGTDAIVRSLPFVEVIPTVWDESLRKGGLIFSQQTNIALDRARELCPNGWGFYMQCDEVICEQDYDQIRKDLAAADAQGCDAVRFRFLHFWHQYDRIAVGRRWFPQEVRALRLKPEVKSVGDALGFQGLTKIYDSDVHIFHYGHVRKKEAYEAKKRHFHRWWHPDASIETKVAQGDRRDQTESTIRYLGPHPLVMKDRVSASLKAEWVDEAFLIGNPNQLSPHFLKGIRAKQIHWGKKTGDFKRVNPEKVVLLDGGSLLDRWRFGSKVPPSLANERARPWSHEFIALLKLSERGIPVDALPQK